MHIQSNPLKPRVSGALFLLPSVSFVVQYTSVARVSVVWQLHWNEFDKSIHMFADRIAPNASATSCDMISEKQFLFLFGASAENSMQ